MLPRRLGARHERHRPRRDLAREELSQPWFRPRLSKRMTFTQQTFCGKISTNRGSKNATTRGGCRRGEKGYYPSTHCARYNAVVSPKISSTYIHIFMNKSEKAGGRGAQLRKGAQAQRSNDEKERQPRQSQGNVSIRQILLRSVAGIVPPPTNLTM